MSSQESTISHWSASLRGLQISPRQFYDTVENMLREEGMPGVVVSRVLAREGGFLSPKREILRVKRSDLTFDINALTFGRDFRVSWKLHERDLEWLGKLIEVPFVSWFAAPLFLILHKKPTQHRIDTMEMFQNGVHTVIVEALDLLTTIQNVPGLSETERKPVMRELTV